MTTGPVLITGGSGFAGRHLAERVLEEGRIVHLMDKAGSIPPNLSRFSGQIQMHRVDLTAPGRLAQLLEEIQPDEVYHLAGIANVKHSWEGESLTYQVNVIGAVNLLSSIRNASLETNILIVGSGEVYGDVAIRNQPIHEYQELNPRSPYAASKVCQEVAARQLANHLKGKMVFVRPFNHIGPGQAPSFVASDFARQIARIERKVQEPAIHVGNLSAQRDFSDVRDTVDAYTRALRFGKHLSVYNVSSGKALPIQFILDWLLKLTPEPIQILVDTDRFRPADVPYLCGSYEQLHKDTGWQPARSITETLLEILEYWRTRPGE